MEKTNNLYENWVKKPEMILLLEESNKHPLYEWSPSTMNLTVL